MNHSDDTLAALSQAAYAAPILERDEEERLVREVREGSERAMHQLLASHFRLVISHARRYARSGIGLEDLVAEGNLGLVEAVHRFDPSRGTRFATYAAWWVRAFVRRYAYANRRIVPLPSTRNARRVISSLGRARRELEATLGATASSEQIADALGVEPGDVESVEVALRSRDVPVFHTEPDSLLADAELSPEDVVAAKQEAEQARARVADAMGTLSQREQHILVRRILDEETETLAALGDDMGLSRERIRQIEKRAQEKLRTVLAEVA